jgi:cobalt-zinc-cadmium efflux system membrane fusion protein
MNDKHAGPFAKLCMLAGIIAGSIAFMGCKQVEAPAGTPSDALPLAAESAVKAPGSPEGVVTLTGAQVKEFGVETGVAGPGKLRVEIVLPGEVTLNADRVGHVIPRVQGVVREVRKNLGDNVRRGEVMAVLESRELADSTAALFAARERVNLAQSNFAREEQLWRKKISSEQDFIQAKILLAESGIALRNTEQKLRALGFSEDYIARLSDRPENMAIFYEMIAPFDATIIEKHVSLGEVLREDSNAFVIADLSTVWANLDVNQMDLPLIQIGQIARIGAGNMAATVEGRISFLEPIAQETNRTIHARVVIPNATGLWRPGLFVTSRIAVDNIRIPVLVPSEALILVGGKPSLFLKEGGKYRIQPVSTGRTDGSSTEITVGLAAGQLYVTKGAFTLKSELGKLETEK